MKKNLLVISIVTAVFISQNVRATTTCVTAGSACKKASDASGSTYFCILKNDAYMWVISSSATATSSVSQCYTGGAIYKSLTCTSNTDSTCLCLDDYPVECVS